VQESSERASHFPLLGLTVTREASHPPTLLVKDSHARSDDLNNSDSAVRFGTAPGNSLHRSLTLHNQHCSGLANGGPRHEMRLLSLALISILLFFSHPGTGRSITRLASERYDRFVGTRSTPRALNCDVVSETDAYDVPRRTYGPVLGWESDEAMEER
jgi:hypothetical protein